MNASRITESLKTERFSGIMSKTNRKLKNNNAESETTDMKTSCSPVIRASSNSGEVSPIDTTNGKLKSVLGSSISGDFLLREANSLKFRSGELEAEASEKARRGTPCQIYERTSAKRKRSDGSGGWKRGFDVMSEWLNYYADEETDVDSKPLINKRTERRKKHKIWKEQALRIEEPIDD